MSIKEGLKDSLTKIITGTVLVALVTGTVGTCTRGCRGITEEEHKRATLQRQYRHDKILAYERLSRDADLNWDGKMDQEEYNHALKLGGYIGRELKVVDLTSGELPEHNSLEILNRAITKLEAERFKELDN